MYVKELIKHHYIMNKPNVIFVKRKKQSKTATKHQFKSKNQEKAKLKFKPNLESNGYSMPPGHMQQNKNKHYGFEEFNEPIVIFNLIH